MTKSSSKRTLRFTPFDFFSPSKTLSNLPMLAVLTREVASVLLISLFRCSLDEGPETAPSPWARAVFCAICCSFLAIRAFRSALATLEGSCSMSVESSHEHASDSGGDWACTSISRNLREPLLFELLVFSFPPPSVNPFLFLLVPNGLLLLSV